MEWLYSGTHAAIINWQSDKAMFIYCKFQSDMLNWFVILDFLDAIYSTRLYGLATLFLTAQLFT